MGPENFTNTTVTDNQIIGLTNYFLSLPFLPIGWFDCFIFLWIVRGNQIFDKDKRDVAIIMSFLGGLVTYILTTNINLSISDWGFPIIMLWVASGIGLRLLFFAFSKTN